MVNAAETDIVSPSVTTEDPLGFLSQEVFALQDFLSFLASAGFQSSNQLICSSTVGSAYAEGIQPFLTGSLNVFFICSSNQSLYFGLQTVTQSLLSQEHTVTELSVILEQRVGPCRTLSFSVYSVRCGR